jgi:hypothetical protein
MRSTRVRVGGLIRPVPRNAFDTVMLLTPAALATSDIVAARRDGADGD